MKIRTGLDNKRVAMNILFSCIAYLINMFISLFITPYITEQLGADAYGFVKLANDFSSYGSLVTLALNSMASRFIIIENEKGNIEEARSYYTSITIANIIISIILLIPIIWIIRGINVLFNVPDDLLVEVRWTFIWTLSNFIICLSCTTVGNCFFLKNRLDISSILTSITSIIRAVFIVVAFAVVGPNISIMAFGSIVVTAIFVPCNILFHHKLTPELYFDRKSFDLKKVWVVISSGVWNSITKLSNILTTGLDLTITNIFLGALEMGYISVAKTIPNFITALIDAIGNSFTPNMMQLYVTGDTKNLKSAIKSSMRIMSIFSTIPNAILISFGTAFYHLWVPNQPSQMINTLSIITVINSCVLGPMQPIYQIFTLTNKIRQSSVAFIVQGFSSILITIWFVKACGSGVYAVAGVSVVLSFVTAFFFHLPMGAIYIGMPWYTFFPDILKNVMVLIVQCVIGIGIRKVIPVEQSWLMWFTGGMILGIIGFIITLLGILERDERWEFLLRIKKYLHKK